VLAGVALVVLCVFTGAAYWTGTRIGAQACVSRSINELKGVLGREREARALERRAAAIHAKQLAEINRRHNQDRQQLDARRRTEADCDTYLSRPEHQCAREFLFGVPGAARPGGD
jgi:hypothetical protein